MIHRLRLHVPRLRVEVFADLLDRFGFTCVSWFEDEESFLENEVDANGFPLAEYFWVTGYVTKDFDAEKLQSELNLLQLFLGISDITLQKDLIDPKEHTPSYTIYPGKVGPFWVTGYEEQPPSHGIPLYVEASTAFGSGDHPTTKGCLLALSDLSVRESPQSVLDLGCGSGILTMACVRLWPASGLYACDLDPESVRVTQENIKRNHISSFVEVGLSAGFQNPLFQRPYDGIVANILAGPLCLMAKEVSTYLKPQGWIILSGLLEKQINQVLSAYQMCGMFLEKSYILEGWAALMLRKPK